MKNYNFTLLIAFLLLFRISVSASTYANTAENEIYSAFNEIEQVVDFIASNEDVNYTDLIVNNFNTNNLSSSAAMTSNMNSNENKPPIISAYWWGCLPSLIFPVVGGVAGVVVVYATTKDNKQVRSSIFGCLTPTCIQIVISGIVLLSYP